MPTIIYSRVSTQRQADGLSLESQEDRARLRALSDGHSDVRIIRDAGVSGKTLTRPGIRQLLAMIDQVDAIYVWSLSRLGRNTREILEFVEDVLLPREIQLVSLTEALDSSTPHGRFSLTVLAALAALQREQTLADTRRGLQARADRGLQTGRIPFGYLGGQEVPLPDPETAPIAAEIIARYAAGESALGISRWLHSIAVETASGTDHWDPSVVRWVVRNPFYCGLIRHNGELLPGAHDGLISATLWQQAQDAHRKRRMRRRRPGGTYGTTLYSCGLCGAPAARQIGNARTPARYDCSRRRDYSVADRHAPMSCSAAKADHHLWEAVVGTLAEGTIADALRIAAQHQGLEGGSEEERLRDEIARLELRLGANVDLHGEGLMTRSVLETVNRPLMVQWGAARAALDAELAQQVHRGEPKRWELLSEQAADGYLGSLDSAARFDLLSRLLSRVELHKGRLVVTFAAPGAPSITVPLPRYWGPRRQPRPSK